MRVLMMALLLSTAMPVAAEWVKYFESDVATFHFDPVSIRVNGHLRQVQELLELKQRHRDGEMSRRALREYDCEEKRHRTLSFTTHAEPMAGGSILYSRNESGRWFPIAPGSGAEGILKVVCAVRE
jgi:hypothetical protein